MPLKPADVKAAIDFGASARPADIVDIPAAQLGNGESEDSPWGYIMTPWLTLAFASFQAHSKYETVSQELISEARATRTFYVMAEAFNTDLHMNDSMIVVIKQNGKVIHPVSKQLHSDEEVIDIGDDAGYRTSLEADFSYKQLNVNEPFTVVIANYGMTGQEKDFDIDPTQFH